MFGYLIIPIAIILISVMQKHHFLLFMLDYVRIEELPYITDFPFISVLLLLKALNLKVRNLSFFFFEVSLLNLTVMSVFFSIITCLFVCLFLTNFSNYHFIICCSSNLLNYYHY
eukprot:gene8855-6235_t